MLHQTKRLQTLSKMEAVLEGRRPLIYPKIPIRKRVTVLRLRTGLNQEQVPVPKAG